MPAAAPKNAIGIGGKLLGSLFFLFFLGMGSLFVWLIAREAIPMLQTWTWPKIQCEIVRSAVAETSQRRQSTGDYHLEIEYRYTVNGQTYTSGRYRLRPESFQDYGKVERLQQSYLPGSRAVCYFNPQSPAQSVLKRGNLVFPLAVLFPLIFVAIGAFGILGMWKTGFGRRAANADRPLSDRAGAFPQRFAIAFFALFIIVGLIVFFFVGVRPLAKVFAARQWPAVTCKILSSGVRSHRGNHGDTYSVNVLYTYVFDDREYKANAYDFFGGSSSGFAGKQAIANRYSPGRNGVCYVNPADPTQAVLERGFTPLMWIALLPLVFVLFGFIGIASRARWQPSAGSSATDGARIFSGNQGGNWSSPDASYGSAPLVLKPRSSPAGKWFAITICMVFWNGIISVFLWNLLKSWRSGYFEWFLVLFLIPFVLIGLGLIAATGYFLLAVFNPRPQITLIPGAPRLGDSIRLDWEITGRVEALQKLQLRLEGREEATYTRDTRSTTDRSVFARVDIATASATQEMRSGTANVQIPANLMHSFATQHNKIVWSLQVNGEIPRWPDLSEEFPLTVLPAAAGNSKIS